jgi:hypothetical protein
MRVRSLYAVRTATLALEFRIEDADRVPIAALQLARYWPAADLQFGERRYKLRRAGFLSRRFVMSAGATIVAEATKPSLWRRRFLLDNVEMATRDFGVSFDLRDARGRLGRVSDEFNVLTEARMLLERELEAEPGLLLLWIALEHFKRKRLGRGGGFPAGG